MSDVTFKDLESAMSRLSRFLTPTPILQSRMLNQWLGHQILFKAECFQRTGAFKIRGALNTLSWLQEQGKLPQTVIANSSGNHAQAVALAANLFGIQAQIFSPKNISSVKASATEYYGAELILAKDRAETDRQVAITAQDENTFWIPPFDHPHVIAGQGTATIEAIDQVQQVDAVVAPCGGGGLLSGTLLAAKELTPMADVIGVEPKVANDVAQSLLADHIIRLPNSPSTLADGAATLQATERTMHYLRQLDGFYEVDEQQIAYWTQWLQHLLKLHVEPTAAMSMAGVAAWCAEQTESKRVLVILSGGNIDQQKQQAIWREDYLQQPPIL